MKISILFTLISTLSVSAANVQFKNEPSTNTVKNTDLLLLDSDLGGGTYSTRTVIPSYVVEPFLYWADVKMPPFNAKGDGVTDDTAAVQAAINSVTNSGGTVFFPPGIYFLNGAYSAVTGAAFDGHAILHMPVVDGNATSCITIKLLGAFPPAPLFGTVSSGPMSTSGSIILVTNIPAQSYYTIVGNSGPSSFNGIHLWIENLTFRSPPNTGETPVNCSYVGRVTIKNTVVDTGMFPAWVQPTGTATGIRLPIIYNSGMTRLEQVLVINYPVGISMSEHADLDQVIVSQCNVAFELTGGLNTIRVGKTLILNCPVGIQVDNPQSVSWQAYDCEHYISGGTNAWMTSVYDLDDTTSNGQGFINWSATTSVGGIHHVFNKNGGTNVVTKDLNAYQ